MGSLPWPDGLQPPLADDIRAHLGPREGLVEREMFGGIVFMLHGNMAVGVVGDDLMVRVGKEAHDEALTRPGARIFAMSARPMRGWVLVSADGLATDEALAEWIDRGVGYSKSLPPK